MRAARRQAIGESGLTLMEVLVAMTLLSFLTVGIMLALRVALDASAKANLHLIDNRRVAGTQRILEQEIAGFMPVIAACGANPDPQTPKTKMPFFQGEPAAMRFVSTYSLHEAWRGQPQILELLVIPRDDGQGVRLVVNEHLYTGPLGAGRFCLGPASGLTGGMRPQFVPVQASPDSFILADKLAFCRFTYLTPAQPPLVPTWQQVWAAMSWPLGVRVDMAPFADDASRLRPVTITQRIQVNRSPEITYEDQ